MDLTTISEWLKTTIPGIVILGAFGSLIAAFVLWAIPKLLPSLKTGCIKIITSVAYHFAYPATYSLAKMTIRKNENSLHAFFALQVIKAALALSIGTCAFIVFIFAVNESELVLFRG